MYGTFATKKKKISRYAVIGVLFSTLAIGTGLAVFSSKEKPENNLVEIPKAEAIEIPGWWLKDYFGVSVCEKDNCKKDADPDNDKLTNAQEFYYHSDPLNRDTNGNGLTDGEDVAYNYDPSKPGKVTFEQAASDDEVLGESLLYDREIKNVIEELTSMEGVRVPVVNEAELVVTKDNTKQGMIDYLNKTDEVIQRHFPKDLETYITETLNSQGDDDRLNDLKIRITQTIIDFKKIPVPSDALPLHKYQIGSFQTSLAVIAVPASDAINNVTDPAANFWYDQVQTYAYLGQQIDIETRKLKLKYQW